MIYVTENKLERQLALLYAAAQLSEATVAVAWLYSYSNAKSVAGLVVAGESDGLLPVTTYGDGSEHGLHTNPTPFSSSLVAELVRKKSKVIRCCDSIAIYRPNEKDWFACSIHHEGMCLVKDESLLAEFTQQGFIATIEAPSWW